ncbi:neuropeptides capa receptor-like [Orbicella faveolata]|uniref:neuropeptides capa receptor-like n=1 Tax=Orbicella faveolata TaxID=48498 RepID=UPI0009E1C953|nr:neuropeptides capa receptor-like [Orbicella faveolata]
MSNFNQTDPYDSASCPYAVSILFTTAVAIISLAGLIGNILVIFSVYKTPSLRTSTNYYYVNMAVSDLIASVTIWPLYLTDEIITSSGSLLQEPHATTACKVGIFFRLASTIVSILSLVLIAVDRFIAIVFPLKATLITSKLRAAFLCATWLISTVYCFLAPYHSRVRKVGRETFCRFAWNELASTIYFVTGLTLFTVTPLITIIVLYLRIMRSLRTRLQPQDDTRASNLQKNRSKQNQNVMKIFKSIVIAYFVTYSFLCVYFVLKIAFPELSYEDSCKLILGFTYFVLPSLSTAINPVILFAFSSNFRQALRKMLPFRFSNSVHVVNTSVQERDEPTPDQAKSSQTQC